MVNNQREGMFKNHVIKTIIPILILVVLGGLWFSKNTGKFPATIEMNDDFALNVTEKLNLEQLKTYGLPIIIDFGADSCIPCKEMAPVLNELNKELQGKAIIKFVDVWKYQSFSQDYPIRVIPTQVLIDSDGNPYAPKDANAIQLNMYSSKDTGKHIFTTHEGGITKEQLLSILKEMGLEE